MKHGVLTKAIYVKILTMLYSASLSGGAVGSVAVRTASVCLATVTDKSGFKAQADWIIAAYAFRLISRAGTEGSMVPLNCDRWLILGLEVLSH